MKTILSIILAFLTFQMTVLSQERVGVGTSTPDRILDVEDNLPVVGRVHSTSGGASMKAGLMLLRQGPNKDYQFINQNGDLQILSSDDDFSTSAQVMRIKGNGEISVGTSQASTKLHIFGSEDASTTSDGYMILGDKSGSNLVFDPNEIQARNNGIATPLTFNNEGGDVVLQQNGGNSYFALADGYVTAGNASGEAKFNIGDNGFQLHLQNNDGGINDWYIGASEDNWVAGDNQLLFSPENSSNSAVFRLTTSTDNNGITAPVIIRSSGDQILLMDGNEIDSRHGPLYINYNSSQNTYINSSGGEVGIGTNNPNGTLHMIADPGQYGLTLEKLGNEWNLNPYINTNNLGFLHDGALIGRVEDASGAWVALSDANSKENIQAAGDMLPIVKSLNLKSYHFKHDVSHQQQVGFLAQEVRKYLPSLVHENENGQLALAYSQLSSVAIKALQEQDKQITQLEKELEELVKQLSKFESIPATQEGE